MTKTLIPMAALDDLVGALVFFLVMAFVSAHLSTAGIPVPVVLFLVFLPVLIGMVTGFITGKLLQHTKTRNSTLAVMLVMLLVSAGIGFFINNLLPTPVLNFMLLGWPSPPFFANMVTKEQLDGMMKVMNPVISFSLVVAILNLAAPLDYHLIFGAGIYTTVVYIITRAIGKYSGAYFGASITHAPDTVKKYLGSRCCPTPGSLWCSPASRSPSWRGRHRSAPPSSRGRSRRRRSSMKSSRSTWPRRALSGPENCIRRNTSGPADISIKVDSWHDTEGAAGPQQGGDLPGCHGRVWNPRLRQGGPWSDLREPRHFQGHDVSLLLQYSNKDELFLLCVERTFTV